MALREDDQYDTHPVFEGYRRSWQAISRLSNQLPEREVRRLAQQIVANLASPRAEDAEDDAAARHRPASEDLDRLCTALVAADDDAAMRMMLQRQAEGVPLEVLYVGYLAEAARRLGRDWDDDRLNFAEVTIGTGRIFAIMCGLRSAVSRTVSPAGRVALFASAPGNQHRLGLEMATEFFREKGWHIDVLSGGTHDEIADRAAATRAGIIGLSASTAETLPALERLVITLRSRLPGSVLLVSGPVVENEGAHVAQLGADFVTADLGEALRLLEGTLQPAEH